MLPSSLVVAVAWMEFTSFLFASVVGAGLLGSGGAVVVLMSWIAAAMVCRCFST